MGILTKAWEEFAEDDDLARYDRAWRRYQTRLAAIRNRFPLGARRFAEASWHYDVQDHRCPHDAWVDQLLVLETGRGARRQRRHIDMEVRLLGAYHDGSLTLRYRNVLAYRFERLGSGKNPRSQPGIGHGNWLTDDFDMSRAGNVIHEVLFERGSWHIECSDLSCRWQPDRGSRSRARA